MPQFDFIEIGTSDFSTEAENASDDDIGLSIDIIKHYLDRVPSKPNCIKYNAAISNQTGETDVYYVLPNNIIKYNLPEWVRGCSSVNKPHPTVTQLLSNWKINQNDVIEHIKVDMLSFKDLVDKFDVTGINHLKIDTEGHDCVILNNYCDMLDQLPSLRANEIQFESNVLISRQDLTKVLARLFTHGYELISSEGDTILRLPISVVSTFDDNKIHPRCYIKDHPIGYNPTNLPHANTLESALSYARSIGCHGVTYQDGRFTVRTGRYFMRVPIDIYSVAV